MKEAGAEQSEPVQSTPLGRKTRYRHADVRYWTYPLAVAKILVIEDSKVMRLYLRGRLEEAGYEVEEWLPLSAMEIPEYIIASAPDLVLSDYQMPGCNGASVARMVQKANPRIPLLILTSFKTKEMDANLQKFGVRQVLSKPIGTESLIRAIAGALEPASQSS